MKRFTTTFIVFLFPLLSVGQDTVDITTHQHNPPLGNMRRSFGTQNYWDAYYYGWGSPSDHYPFYNAVRHYYPTQSVPIYGIGMPMTLNPQQGDSVDILPAIITKSPDGTFRVTSGRSINTNDLRFRQHDLYLKYPLFPSCDSTDTAWFVKGLYALYFDSPVTVSDTFYFGAGVRLNTSIPGRNGGFFRFDYFCNGDEAGWIHNDSNTCLLCFFTQPTPDPNSMRMSISTTTYSTVPYILLTAPPPPPDTFSCPDIHDFTFLGLQAGIPAFAWTAADEHSMYEICYGPYDADPETLPKVSTSAGFLELSDVPLDSGTYYQARCRAICRHACRVHDTTLWTPWSEPQFFFVGEQMPDTAHADTATTGIYRTPARTLFSVSPNPARDEVSVTIDGNYHDAVISFRDSEGRELIRQRAAQRRTAVGTKHLPKGVYIVTVTTKDTSASQKLMIE